MMVILGKNSFKFSFAGYGLLFQLKISVLEGLPVAMELQNVQ